jgi:putative phage-type endonuclease
MKKKLTKITTHSREEWQALRHKYIGGSDAASVVGLNPFRSPYALWAEKTGKTPSFEGNLATEVGTYLEDFVAKKFEEVTGKKVRRENHSILNDKYPWAIANVDRLIIGEDAGLEIKTTSELNTKSFKNGEFPANYYCQCIHYLAMTGKKKWYLAVLIGNKDFRIFEIERDEAEIDALMGAEREFWSCVTNNTPPSTDGSKSTSKTLTALYPNSEEETVSLFGFEVDLAEYSALKNQIKSLEERKSAIENKIKAHMNKASMGESGRFKVSYPTQTKSTFDVKRFNVEHPDIDISGYFNVSIFRKFIFKEKK